MIKIVDKHYEKEYNKKKGKAHKDYLYLIKMLSKIDESNKERNHVQKSAYEHFKAFREIYSEKKAMNIASGKSWIAGFVWALKHIDKLHKSKDNKHKWEVY